MSAMITIDGFSKDSIELVNSMLFAERQENPYKGQCGQKAKREAAKQPRTPDEQQADKERAQNRQGKDTVPSGVRSAAAKKAAETRRRCKGLPTTP